MGQKSKQASPDVNLKLASMMVPIDLLNFFDIHQVHEKPNEWQILLLIFHTTKQQPHLAFSHHLQLGEEKRMKRLFRTQ